MNDFDKTIHWLSTLKIDYTVERASFEVYNIEGQIIRIEDRHLTEMRYAAFVFDTDGEFVNHHIW